MNRNLNKLLTDAAKRTCQTCGMKREDEGAVEEEVDIKPTMQQRPTLPPRFKPTLPDNLRLSLPATKSTKDESMIRISNSIHAKPKMRTDTWQPPAERYAGVKQKTNKLNGSQELHRSSTPPVPASTPSPSNEEDIPPLETGASSIVDAPLTCPTCTFINPPRSHTCRMCDQSIPSSSAALIDAHKPTPNRGDPIDFTTSDEVQLTYVPPPSSVEPDSPSTLDIVFEATSGDRDEVDDLFAAAHHQLQSKPHTVTAANAPTELPSKSSTTTAMDADFLEASDDEQDQVKSKPNAQPAKSKSKPSTAPTAPARLNEDEQIRLATEMSLREMQSKQSQRGPGVSFGSTTLRNVPPQPSVNLPVGDLPSTSATDNFADDDVDWVDDDDVIPIHPPARTSSRKEDGVAAMELDEPEDDQPQVQPIPSNPIPAHPVAQPPSSHKLADCHTPSPSLPSSISISTPPFEPTVKTSASTSPPSESVNLLSQHDQESEMHTIQPAASGQLSPPTPAKQVTSPAPPSNTSVSPHFLSKQSPFFPTTPSSTLPPSDSLVVAHPDDDAETRHDREELKRLLHEVHDITEEIEEAKAQAETVAEEIPPPTSPSSTMDDDEVMEIISPNPPSVAEDSTATQSTSTSSSAAPTAAAVAVATTSSSTDGLILPPGVTLNSTAVPSAKTKSHIAFLESQKHKRQIEIDADNRRRDEQDTIALAESLPDHAASVPLSHASEDRRHVYEAFPAHLTAEQSISLSNSFDSSYLDFIDASKQQAKALQGEAHVTEEMLEDVKMLLRLFGIPYVESPGEAEAQCAALEQLGYVDGVITDDSDVFLFGAKNVYRHFFESKKFCEKYSMEEITLRMGVDRKKLINYALLLGSDYTTGVRGIGIVNASEILNAFPGDDGLEQLRDWIWSSQPDLEPNLPNYPDECTFEERARLDAEYRLKAFKYAHRNVKHSWAISRDSFPNREVIDVYWHPNVDNRTGAEFTWGQPNWEEIKKLCRERLEWSDTEIVAQFGPVEKAMATSRQIALDRFFGPNDSFAVIASDRLNRAVRGLVQQTLTEEEIQHRTQSHQRKAAQAEKRKQAAKDRKRKKAGESTTQGATSRFDFEFDLTAEDEAMLQAVERAAAAANTNTPPKQTRT